MDHFDSVNLNQQTTRTWSWKGGIRTPVLRREQIYSLPPLTTRPPSNKKISFYSDYYTQSIFAPTIIPIFCSPQGDRTPISRLKTQRPNHQTNGPYINEKTQSFLDWAFHILQFLITQQTKTVYLQGSPPHMYILSLLC